VGLDCPAGYTPDPLSPARISLRRAEAPLALSAPLMSRSFLAAAAAVALSSSSSAAAAPRISVGAIRWDAWYWDAGIKPGPGNVVGRAVTLDMSVGAAADGRWHYRVPFFGSLTSKANASLVNVNGNTPETMAAELAMAKQFGVDFWAYCAYPIGCRDYNPPLDPDTGLCGTDDKRMQCCADNYRLSYALELHLRSPQRALVNVSLILQASWFPSVAHGGNESAAQEAARFVRYFQLPFYHRVDGGRPLLFLLGGAGDPVVLGALQTLLAAAQAAMGGVAPFLVYMPGTTLDLGQGVVADAAGKYLLAVHKVGGNPYEAGAMMMRETRPAHLSPMRAAQSTHACMRACVRACTLR
jgi:hypothetical protein